MGNHWTNKWRLQPVRRCCKGSQPARVAPALRNNKMRITKIRLKKIIKEELRRVLKEFGPEMDRMQCLDKMRAKFPSPEEQSGPKAAAYMEQCMERGPENMQEADR